MRCRAVDMTVGKASRKPQRGTVEPRQIETPTKIEPLPDVRRKQRHRSACNRAVKETRHAGRGAARLDDVEEFEDDRVRLEAGFERVHHRHEGSNRRRRMPRAELASDRVAVCHEAVLVAIAQRMDEAVIGHEEAVGRGRRTPVEQHGTP